MLIKYKAEFLYEITMIFMRGFENKMMDKFYAQHQFPRLSMAGLVNLRDVFGDVETHSAEMRRDSDSPCAQKGAQKHNAALPEFVNVLKNLPSIFSRSSHSLRKNH